MATVETPRRRSKRSLEPNPDLKGTVHGKKLDQLKFMCVALFSHFIRLGRVPVQEFFSVIRVLDERVAEDGTVQFKVKWAGQQRSGEPYEDSWVPSTYLKGVLTRNVLLTL